MSKNRNPHIGSALDDLLEEDGILAEAHATAIKRTLAWQVSQTMAHENLSKAEGVQASKKFHLQAQDMEQLLVMWLNEVAFWIQTRGFVPQTYHIRVNTKRPAARGEARGRRYAKIPIIREVKSATYHGLKIRQHKGSICATVILDV